MTLAPTVPDLLPPAPAPPGQPHPTAPPGPRARGPHRPVAPAGPVRPRQRWSVRVAVTDDYEAWLLTWLPGAVDRPADDHVGRPGVASAGGKTRQIMININPAALSSRGATRRRTWAGAAIVERHQFPPARHAGNLEYNVILNASPRLVEQFNAIPLKVVGNAPVYLGTWHGCRTASPSRSTWCG